MLRVAVRAESRVEREAIVVGAVGAGVGVEGGAGEALVMLRGLIGDM